MRRPFLLITIATALLLAGTSANAGPPIEHETLHFTNEPFTDNIGINCATGNVTHSSGVFSGIIQRFVKPDDNGLLRGSSHIRGTETLDDVPTDGIPDATRTFVSNTVTRAFSLPEGTGKEIFTFTGSGTLTITATGEQLRFHAVAQVVVFGSNEVKVQFFRITCD
jgi:hypothetical protein